jgi:hypothetical protein
MLIEPDQMGGELVGHLGAGARARQHITARNVGMIGEHQGN